MENIYYHARVILYDKPALYDAIRDCYIGKFEDENLSADCISAVNLLIGKYKDFSSSDKVILTQQQRDQLKNSENFHIHAINCSPAQIMLYSHNCITLPTLRRILNGENP